MQLDVDIEPTLRFPGIISIHKQMDQSESEVHIPNIGLLHRHFGIESVPDPLHFYHRQTEGET